MTVTILGILLLIANLANAFTTKDSNPEYFTYSVIALLVGGLILIIRHRYVMKKYYNVDL